MKSGLRKKLPHVLDIVIGTSFGRCEPPVRSNRKENP
jgi:hypothetical protein